MLTELLVVLILIVLSAFFSLAEISLAASRKIKLQQLADNGNYQAVSVLSLQKNPGSYFAVVQVGINGIAILGGIIGEGALYRFFHPLFAYFCPEEIAQKLSFFCSFLLITSLFVLFSDLVPKRLGMIAPERIAMLTSGPMRLCLMLFKPIIFCFNGLADFIFRLFRLPTHRKEDITLEDVSAFVEAGALTGALGKQEYELIENIFQLENRTVPSAMTMRDSIVYFERDEAQESIQQKIHEFPHQHFLVCNESIDQVIGYVDAKALLSKVITGETLVLTDAGLIQEVLIIPDTLTLSEAIDRFRVTGRDFAVVFNEYALVVGVLTLNDLMLNLLGGVIDYEEQIIQRDDSSWLIDGVTPISDVMRALEIEEFPDAGNYDTIGGFIMYMLRKIPKRTDNVVFADFRFEVVDIDHYKIDQVLVTRLPHPQPKVEVSESE